MTDIQKIRLEAFSPAHFGELISWIPDAGLLHQFAGPDWHFPLDSLQLQKDLHDPLRQMYRVVSLPNDTGIGHAQLLRMADGQSARLCRLLIAHTGYRGKGLGSAMLQELLQVCFGEWQLSYASLNVYEYNTGALQCYRNAGFTEKERWMAQNSGGLMCVCLHMQLSRETWEAGRKK